MELAEDVRNPFIGDLRTDQAADAFKAARNHLFGGTAGVHIDLFGSQLAAGGLQNQLHRAVAGQ